MKADEDILEAAVMLPAAERAAYLSRTCGEDRDRRARLEALLQGHEEARDFLATPAVRRPLAVPAENTGDVIDRYRLVERIGEGGCGVVWVAEQEEPLRRQVAFKVIKLGMDTRALVARFETERQVLALMDHPNIARVFDAGVTRTGRPYFVMELVRGVPITRYCDQHRLTTGQRLELFASVCDAVQHAHQKGIIHRDLKPSNILVADYGGAPLPKVIDFGVAKAIHGRPGGGGGYTASEPFIGTPTYMSPEQAGMSGLDVDTRSDIYSLGVLLFELLTAGLPFDAKLFREAGVDEIRRHIREVEPAKPSARLRSLTVAERAEVAERRGGAEGALLLQLRGDLDWIVLRCLEKDRTRRYDSASALAQDIRRHLRHEPVAARPPHPLYVLRKLIRRHRTGFAAAAAIGVVLAAGGGVSVWQAVRATRAEREQSELRRRAETQELATRRQAYAADMNLLQGALENDNLGLARRLLERQKPRSGEPDLRGWEWRYLWQLCQSEAAEIVTRRAHPVPSLSVSPDGRRLAVGQDDGGELVLHDLPTRAERRLAAGDGAVRAVFSRTQPWLAIALTQRRDGQSEHRLRLWNHQTDVVVAEWILAGPPGTMAFSADGSTLVTAGGGRLPSQIDRWRVPRGERLGTLAPAGGGTLAVTPDLAVAAREVLQGGRGKVQVVELDSGRERWVADVSDENVSALAFSPDGKILASAAGNSEASIRLWDARTGAPLGRLEGHRTHVSALSFRPDGRTLVSAGKDQTVRVWDMETRALRRTLRGHELEVHSLELLPDGRSLVSGAKDGVVLRWEADAPRASPYARVDDDVASWRFTADSQGVVSLDHAGRVVRREGRDFSTATVLMEVGPVPRGGRRGNVGWDGPRLAVAGERGDVHVYDWEQGRRIATLVTQAAAVVVVGFTDAGRTLLLAYPGPSPEHFQLHAWDIATSRLARSWHPAESPLMQVTMGSDQRRGVIRDAAGTLSQIDFQTGEETRLAISVAQSGSAGLSPNGRWYAAASSAGWVKVWDLEQAVPIAELSGFVLGVHSATFSPDGQRLVTGSGGDEAIRVWDATGFNALVTLGVQGSRFTSTAVSPDGNLIGSRNSFGRLHVWRAPAWAEIGASETRKSGEAVPPANRAGAGVKN